MLGPAHRLSPRANLSSGTLGSTRRRGVEDGSFFGRTLSPTRRRGAEVGSLLPAALRHRDGAATAGLTMDVRRGAQGAPAGARCREETPRPDAASRRGFRI